jgi:hypothetical protein
MKLDDLVKKIFLIAPDLRVDWSNPEILMEDIRWLCERGFAMSR